MKPLILTQVVFILIAFGGSLVSGQAGVPTIAQQYRYRNDVRGGPGVVKSSLPVDVLREEDIPLHFDWRNIEGKSYVVPTYNQYTPGECGSCWAHASAAALSDRIKRLRNATFPDIEISRQVILNCLSGWNGPRNGCCTCDGGDPYEAYAYIHKHGVPDETCAAYVAAVQSCTPAHTCMGLNGNALPEGSYSKYFVSEFGAYACGNATTTDMADRKFDIPRCEVKYGKEELPRMELTMRTEIFARGPIACCMAITDAFVNLRSHDVYTEATGRYVCDHVVSVSGWGQTAVGKKYWIVRNSFGTSWGENGWFRIERGSNNAGIEQYCAWATPRNDWTMSSAAPLVV